MSIDAPRAVGHRLLLDRADGVGPPMLQDLIAHPSARLVRRAH